jgi:hypothetical protein
MGDNTLLQTLRIATSGHKDEIIKEAKDEFCKPDGHIAPKAADEGAAAGTPEPVAGVDEGAAAGTPEPETPAAEGAQTAEGVQTAGRRSKRRRQKKSSKKSKKGGRSRKNCGSKNRRKLSRRR